MELLAFGKHVEGGGLQGHGTVDKSQETGPVHINLTPAEHPPQLSMDARKDAGLDSCFFPPDQFSGLVCGLVKVVLFHSEPHFNAPFYLELLL